MKKSFFSLHRRKSINFKKKKLFLSSSSSFYFPTLLVLVRIVTNSSAAEGWIPTVPSKSALRARHRMATAIPCMISGASGPTCRVFFKFLFLSEKKNEEKRLKKKMEIKKYRTMWHPTTSSVAESTIIFISVDSFLPESVLRMGLNFETKMSYEGVGEELEEAFPSPSTAAPLRALSTLAAPSSSVRPQAASGGCTKHAVGTLS